MQNLFKINFLNSQIIVNFASHFVHSISNFMHSPSFFAEILTRAEPSVET